MSQTFDDVIAPSLRLSVAGKVYEVPSPPAAVGLRLQASWRVELYRQAGRAVPEREKALRALDETFETTLEQDALGPVYDEMVRDGAPVHLVNHAGMTAYLWIVGGEDAAAAWWQAHRGGVLELPEAAEGAAPDGSVARG